MNAKKFLTQTMPVLTLLCCATVAQARTWQTVQPAQSSIGFVSTQMGVDVPGKFSRFHANILFDADAPQNSHAQVTVDTTSVSAGGTEVDETLKDKDWFDTQHWPQAQFISHSIRVLGGGRFEADGDLSIKGQTRAVKVLFQAKTSATGLVLDGDLPISRTAFAIGSGEWADPSVVANVVKLHFHVVMQ